MSIPFRLAQEALATGDAARALIQAEAGLRERPGDAWGRVLQAAAWHGLGKLPAAEAALDALLPELAQGEAGGGGLLAAALKVRVSLRLDQGREAEALEDLLEALRLQPADPEGRAWALALLAEAGRIPEARAQAELLLPHRSTDPAFWADYARILQRAGDRPGAEAAFRRRILCDPSSEAALLDCAQFLGESGRIAETAGLYGKVLERNPANPSALSGLLAARAYDPKCPPLELARVHREHGHRLEASLPRFPAPERNWDPGRRLRVAYLSPDFRDHSCAHFAEPLFRAHDRTRVHLTLYHDSGVQTPRSEVFRHLADQWVEVHSLGLAELHRRIQEDGIDVLVEMAGHMAHNRLPLLPLRPAPVQLTWLGYPFTTGLSCLDGRVTDSGVDPPGNEAYGTELLRRVDPCYLAWQPPAADLSPRPSPSGPFTFGSFNQFAKLNEAVLQAWAALVRRVPGSRLLLKGLGASDPVTRDRIFEVFREEGIPARRLELLDFTASPREHLELYGQVDLALDPFPYNGVTTTLEALWMGVPVLALEGRHSLARHGASFLRLLGVEDLVARDPQDLVALGAARAADREDLSRLGEGLRFRLEASALCDAPALARRMEALYHTLWAEACGKARARA
ncbi:MAG: hypothetical protein HY823_08160 [Acidobacteria bacterium]|nr:hypothetical protein [Acidobacteriota bacterium]